ncbi:MAG: hypothetical protein IAE93_01180 [Ignavibacteria bacterium]|nr:hypothetical protein [Ignavibacteria bacterium]
MPKIIAAATADAPYKIPQEEIKNFIFNLFSGTGVDINRLISVFDNSGISSRHISVEPEWLSKEHTFKERSEIFSRVAFDMAKKAVTDCLERANTRPNEIDSIIYVTSTGVMTPTLDAKLFNELGFNPHIKRLPLWGLGCAGGAAAISRAMDLTKAYPNEKVLVIAVELCSLTFQKDDLSKSNVVASSLFGDGCACVLIGGDESMPAAGIAPVLLGSLSTIYDNSLDVMGWEIVESGFSVIFSRDIPQIVKENVKPNITELLTKYDLKIEGIQHYITHPGGMKVISAYEESLGLNSGTLDLPRKVLRDHGNMSSVSVIYVLNEFLHAGKYKTGEFGLISSLGPGFSSELCLFKIS